MSYRVETAVSGRAVCNDTECKKNGIKIDKNELRLGTWFEYQEQGSWKWKHWGCVSGHQLENMRTYLADHRNPGQYIWDMLDGYDGDEKQSLTGHPDLQEKVRRAVTQGFIDPADFNGDPEMNVLGMKGIRTAGSKKKLKDDKISRAHEINELKEQNEKLKAELAAARKNGEASKKLEAKIEANEREISTPEKPSMKRVRPEGDDDAEEKKPAKKKRVIKAKKEEDSDDEVMPAKKKRATKAKKEEESDEEVMPAKKARGKRVKNEEDEEMNDDPAPPAKKARAKKAKKEESEAVKNEEDEEAPVTITAPKKRASRAKKAEADDGDAGEPSAPKAPAKKGRKKAVKEEPSEDTTMVGGVESSAVAEESTLLTEPDVVKGEPSDAVELPSAALTVEEIDAKIAALKALTFTIEFVDLGDTPDDQETLIPGHKDVELGMEHSMGCKSGEYDWEKMYVFLQDKRDELVKELEQQKPQPKKGGRGKKAAASASTRTSRSRTSSGKNAA